MAKVMSVISRGLVLWVLLGAVAAYVWPEAFAWTRGSIRDVLEGFQGDVSTPDPYDLLGQPVFKWMFALTMFSAEELN